MLPLKEPFLHCVLSHNSTHLCVSRDPALGEQIYGLELIFQRFWLQTQAYNVLQKCYKNYLWIIER